MNEKIAIIYNEDNKEKDIYDGKIEKIGNKEEGNHIDFLLELAEKKYPEVEIFKKLNYRHRPEIAGIFFNNLGDILFFNLSSTKYKAGFFMMPDEITEKQKETLRTFAEELEDFNITIISKMQLDNDGLLQGNEDRVSGNVKEYLENNYIGNSKGLN